jgi:2-iminobutanoate/2-iminopropanoate deaminase
MEKKIITTDRAPAAIGPYSQAVIGNGNVYISGQLPINPSNGTMPDTLEAQVEQSMKNVLALVEQAGGTVENIVKCGLFIKDMNAFSRINEVYQTFFTDNAPARFVVQVSELPKGAQIEIDAIAVV